MSTVMITSSILWFCFVLVFRESNERVYDSNILRHFMNSRLYSLTHLVSTYPWSILLQKALRPVPKPMLPNCILGAALGWQSPGGAKLPSQPEPKERTGLSGRESKPISCEVLSLPYSHVLQPGFPPPCHLWEQPVVSLHICCQCSPQSCPFMLVLAHCCLLFQGDSAGLLWQDGPNLALGLVSSTNRGHDFLLSSPALIPIRHFLKVFCAVTLN